MLEQQYHHHQHQSHSAVGSLEILQQQQQQQQQQQRGEQGAELGANAVLTAAPEGCTVLEVEMEVQEGGRAAGPCSSAGSSSSREQGGRGGGGGGEQEGERLASEAAEPGGDTAQLPFSRELITFSLFGKMPPKLSEFATRGSI